MLRCVGIPRYLFFEEGFINSLISFEKTVSNARSSVARIQNPKFIIILVFEIFLVAV